MNNNNNKINNNNNKMNNSLFKRIETIINKIIKINAIKKNIQQILLKDRSNSANKFVQISKLIHSHMQKNTKNIEPNRTYISDKLTKYISQNYSIKDHKDIKIADIGGGNGQILKEIGTSLKISKENLYCVEQITPWTEPYAFSNSDHIQYVFWDNNNIPTITPKSLDIVFIMVTLHHMTDETINATFKNLNRLCKSGALLFIKEHDCKTPDDKFVIDWEHHLYHLIETPQQTESQIIQYKKNYVDNYKTKKWIDYLIHNYGFVSKIELNRLFERNTDHNNPSNLYWKIYVKK
jgi:ubiquinone/menaquinone biosynthesis C-methylase UbiE